MIIWPRPNSSPAAGAYLLCHRFYTSIHKSKYTMMFFSSVMTCSGILGKICHEKYIIGSDGIMVIFIFVLMLLLKLS